MALKWRGRQVKRLAVKAAVAGINATMSAAILHAKSDHGAGAHAVRRFETRTGEAERSIRIVEAARRVLSAVVGRWGSVGLNYPRRLELGFQGQDSAGRVVDAPAYPFLQPAADVEYPKLAGRIRRAFARLSGVK